MKTGAKIATVAILALAVAATFLLRGGKRAEYVAVPEQPALAPAAQGAPAAASTPRPAPEAVKAATSAPATAAAPAAPGPVAAAAKPRLLEFGSMRCQACLEMAKVLDALRASQGEKLQVDFIDVFEQPAAADRHKISLIPTQVLYDTTGKEIFRHTGFFSHDDILAKFRALGVQL